MVRINRVYTRKGDTGRTSLVGGRAIGKEHPRVESYGTLDELNSLLGVARGFCGALPPGGRRDGFVTILATIQQRLFDLGAELATPPGEDYQGPARIGQQDVDWLEEIIDTMNEELDPLESFVLPGGSALPAFLHQARAVCRRAERLAVALNLEEPLEPTVLAYLNRLSDALFVFSRWAAAGLEEPETLWQPGLTPDKSWRW
ncbi:MAG: cob(I)yrinic acid a,c-diamide adenosyltransferase [bacterium]